MATLNSSHPVALPFTSFSKGHAFFGWNAAGLGFVDQSLALNSVLQLIIYTFHLYHPWHHTDIPCWNLLQSLDLSARLNRDKETGNDRIETWFGDLGRKKESKKKIFDEQHSHPSLWCLIRTSQCLEVFPRLALVRQQRLIRSLCLLPHLGRKESSIRRTYGLVLD